MHRIANHSASPTALGLCAAMLLALSLGLETRGASESAAAQPTGVVSVASANPNADVLTAAGSKVRRTVKKFRSLLGPNNGGAPSGKRKGRREINWDAVPDEFAAPHALPADYLSLIHI